MFQLTNDEVETMVSQNAIPSKQHLGGALPYAFTEHGVLMLASVLKSEKAMQVSIRVIEIFVKMREMLSVHKDVLLQLGKMEKNLTEHDEDIQLIFKYLNQLLNEPQERTIIEGFVKKNNPLHKYCFAGSQRTELLLLTLWGVAPLSNTFFCRLLTYKAAHFHCIQSWHTEFHMNINFFFYLGRFL